MTTLYPGALDSYSTKVDGVDDVMAADINDPQDAIEALEAQHQTRSLLKVKNAAGATVAANDVGYMDSAGDFARTTSANLNADWAVVIVGGANNTQIVVCRRGRVTITLNANCSIGDYLLTSTTAGRASVSSTMRAEVLAVALTANTGGAGGTCEALLLCGSVPRALRIAEDVYRTSVGSDSDFVATIATLPGGAVLTYNAPSSGDETNLVPASTSQPAKMRLRNSTRTNYGLISNCVTGTNTITLTANVPGDWQVGDIITIRSAVNTDTSGAAYFVEFELVSDVNALARDMFLYITLKDTGAVASAAIRLHPWETGSVSKRDVFRPQVTGVILNLVNGPMPIISNRFCVLWNASGVGTLLWIIRIQSETVASS